MLFVADWIEALFVHFAVEPELLRPLVPLELDCRDGRAYVSLVAFTQRNLRPTVGGALAAWLATPLASHEFLNVRTYVRDADTRGIFFLAEWIPNELAALIGPTTYGLPYRLGKLSYEQKTRTVDAEGKRLQFAYTASDRVARSDDGLDDFLLEHYTAFTHRRGVIRRFDVDHAPWPQRRVDVELLDTSLLALSGDWHTHATLVGANYSPGVRDVAISAPRRVTDRPAQRCPA